MCRVPCFTSGSYSDLSGESAVTCIDDGGRSERLDAAYLPQSGGSAEMWVDDSGQSERMATASLPQPSFIMDPQSQSPMDTNTESDGGRSDMVAAAYPPQPSFTVDGSAETWVDGGGRSESMAAAYLPQSSLTVEVAPGRYPPATSLTRVLNSRFLSSAGIL
jgi:hypothetical protein